MYIQDVLLFPYVLIVDDNIFYNYTGILRQSCTHLFNIFSVDVLSDIVSSVPVVSPTIVDLSVISPNYSKGFVEVLLSCMNLISFCV